LAVADTFGWNGSPLSWGEIGLRLACTLAATALIGLNRRRAGQAAGLRTLMLVGLAAAIAMLQANLLLPARGKTAESFAVLDLMRMPLGILTGIGFIGAGAIVKRGDVVVGVTTAATLWITTVLGLCFGGGQMVLGGAATVLVLVILHGAKLLEGRLLENRQASLCLTAAADGPTDGEIHDRLEGAGFKIVRWAISYAMPQNAPNEKNAQNEKTLECRLTWRGYPDETLPPPLWNELLRDPRLRALSWAAEKGDP
jgi:putative Mg2+ transporter-C (MgtC) family protein